MSSKSPIFPMPQPQHFSDYGFDPQVDYFQDLEEARRYKRETTRSSIDSKHLKLQKPIPKDDSRKPHHNKTKKKQWWKSALLFFKWNKLTPHRHDHHRVSAIRGGDEDVQHQARAKASRASISGPVYITESRSGSCTPYLSTSRPSPGPLAGTMSLARKDGMGIPYLNLRELNMEQQQQRNSTSAVPIYLVT